MKDHRPEQDAPDPRRLVAHVPISVLHRAISNRWAPFSATLSQSNFVFLAARPESRMISRARVPDLVGSRFPSPYHFRARIQSFQAVAPPFPGDSSKPRLPDLSSKGRAAPTGIGGGLKSSKSTIASFWFSRNKNRRRKSPPPFHWKMSHGGPVSRSVAHLWFLYVLLEFYAAILVLRGGVALMDRGGGIRAGVDRLVRLLMRGPLEAILMAAPLRRQ